MPELTRRRLLTGAGVAAAAMAAPGLSVAEVRARRGWDFDPARHRLALFALGARAIAGVRRAAPGLPVEHPVAVTWEHDDLPGDLVWGHIALGDIAALAREPVAHQRPVRNPQPWQRAALAAWIAQLQLESSWRGLLNHADRALLAVDPDGFETLGAAEAVIRSLDHRAVPVLCLACPLRGDLARGPHDARHVLERLYAAGAMPAVTRPADESDPEAGWAAALRRCAGCTPCLLGRDA